ncbi:MAG TPA: hypothetical protein VGH99_02515 [Pseudonocardia sp.]
MRHQDDDQAPAIELDGGVDTDHDAHRDTALLPDPGALTLAVDTDRDGLADLVVRVGPDAAGCLTSLDPGTGPLAELGLPPGAGPAGAWLAELGIGPAAGDRNDGLWADPPWGDRL